MRLGGYAVSLFFIGYISSLSLSSISIKNLPETNGKGKIVVSTEEDFVHTGLSFCPGTGTGEGGHLEKWQEDD